MTAVFLLTGCGSSRATSIDGADFFGITDDSQAAIVIDGELSESAGLVREEGVYLPWSLVWNSIDSAFYYEKASGSLYLTYPEESYVWTADDGSGNVFTENEEAYILSDCVAGYADADVKVYNDPARVVIYTEKSSQMAVTAVDNAALYLRPGNKGGKIRDVSEGERLFRISDEDGWSLCASDDGYTGYIDSTLIDASGNSEGTKSGSGSGRKFEKQDFGDRVRMIWDFIEFRDDNQYLEPMTQAVEGVNVISPTWYAINNLSGNVASLADGWYVNRSHDYGMDVWPMISDYRGDGGGTGDILSTEKGRQTIIGKLMQEADAYGFDGINVDFEMIPEEHIPDFIQFLRELAVEAHKRSLIVSVDNYVPTYFGYYNRTAQMKACDYIVVMAYDEHTGTSDSIGSVASLPFVRDGIEGTLEEVPADRLILGVPFYTRGWTETFGEEGFTSQTLDMEGMDNFIIEHGIDTNMYWDEGVGQYCGSSTDSAARYSIWKEEADSLRMKLNLVNEYSLAGAAAWRLGYEVDTIWQTWTECLGK